MSKAINASLIEGLEAEVKSIDSCVLVGTVGMSVAEVSDFRKKLRNQNFRMRVVRNGLARKSFERRGWGNLGEKLRGPSAVIFGGEGAIAISKLVVDEKKTHKDKLVVHGGYSEGEILDAQGIDALSKVPGKRELLAMTLAGLAGPLSGMAQNMDGLLTEMQGLIEALATQKEKADAPAS